MHPKRGIFIRLEKLLGGLLLSLFLFVPTSFALECQDIKQMVQFYLRMHFSIHEFSPEISQRTLTNFIRMWDPGKVYFMQEDIDAIQKKLSSGVLPKMIEKADCSGIDYVFKLYSQRVGESQQLIPGLVAAKHDFSVDEYLNIDRKTMPYAKTSDEIKDRWRKRVKFQFLQLLKSLPDEKKVREKLLKRYELADKRHKDLTTDDVYGFFMDSFATSLDPHTDYFSPTQLEEFRISTRLSLEGIGALLRSEDGVTSIQSLVPGGAAQKTGLIKVDDKIVAVAQGSGTPVDVIDMDLKDVVKLIRGPGGTEVRLSLRRGTKDLIAPVIREKVQLKDRAAKSKVYDVEVEGSKEATKYKIGVLDLPSFYMDFEGRQANQENFRSSSRDMAKEIIAMQAQQVHAIIVDLRSNGGGALDEAINVAGLFGGSGPVVQVKGSDPKTHISNYEGAAIYKGPLVLLIDRQSASASEILAGAIKDYGRGLIVGDAHTFGKGTVQNLNDLDPKLGAIKVTISKFYLPSGDSTQLRGVASDVVLPSIADQYEIGEKHYDYALPWESVKPAQYSRLTMVAPYVKPLQQASASRLKATNPFKEVQEAISKYKEGKEERMRVSLKAPTPKEKAAEEKERKLEEEMEKKLDKDAYGNILPKLDDDTYLQETLQITADYLRLLEKKKVGNNKILALQKPAQQEPAVKSAQVPAEVGKVRPDQSLLKK